jgi:hypothetical protein
MGERENKFLSPRELFQALKDAGIADDTTARVVIDLNRGDAPIMYLEKYMDRSFLRVIPTLEGIQISREERDGHRDDAAAGEDQLPGHDNRD